MTKAEYKKLLAEKMASDPVFAAQVKADAKVRRAERKAMFPGLTPEEREALDAAAQKHVLDPYAAFASNIAARDAWVAQGNAWYKVQEPCMSVDRVLRFMDNDYSWPGKAKYWGYSQKYTALNNSLNRLKKQGKLASSVGPGDKHAEVRMFEPVDFQRT